MYPDSQEIILNLNAAYERLIAAEYLLEKGLFSDAVNRGYYVMFHAAVALLLVKGISVKTHAGLIGQFGQSFVINGEIDKKFGRMFANAEELREKADYSISSHISKEQAESLLIDAKEFLKMATEKIRHSGLDISLNI